MTSDGGASSVRRVVITQPDRGLASGALGPWRRALVTGASSGIGEAFVDRLAFGGTPVVVVARRRDRLDALAERWPGLVEVLCADLADRSGLNAVAGRVADSDRPIDLLVNNAGIAVGGPFHARSVDDHLEQIELNITALVVLTRAALGGMVARKRGWVLQVSSLAGFHPGPTLATYAATKSFVTNLTEAMAEELRGTGVHVCALCPGLTVTEAHGHVGMSRQPRPPRAAWMSADDVAVAGLRALAAGRVLEVPGLGNQAIAVLSDLLPRPFVRHLIGLATRPRTQPSIWR
jgi:uncharacterized protein